MKELYINREEVEKLIHLMNNFNTDYVKIVNTDTESNLGGEDGVMVELRIQKGEFEGMFSTKLRSEPLF